MNKIIKALIISLIFSFGLGLAQGTRNVYINMVQLDAETLSALESYYGHIPSNYYWYDSVSGLIGLQGGPAFGQIATDLPLGGPLQVNASGGGTGVFVNGREIHVDDYLALVYTFGEVYPGYYWLDGQGYYGYEGGPALGNLYATSTQNTGAGNTGVGGGYGGYIDRGYGGTYGSDGNCYYIDVGSGSYMPPGC